jgi:hypothetical protein
MHEKGTSAAVHDTRRKWLPPDNWRNLKVAPT